MKLIKKTNTYYLFFLALLFPIMLGVDYYVIQYTVNYEVEDILLHEQQRINYHLAENKELPSSNYLMETKALHSNKNLLGVFRDTVIYEAYADKNVPYRLYSFTATKGELPLRVTLKHVLLEINELIWWLFMGTSFILLLLGIGFYFINKKIYTWAWNPFFENLSKLKSYGVTQEKPIHLKSSKISEFEELNEVVTTLMEQVRKDFQNLKEFNENISHEIQTPLTIIRNKVVLLLGSGNLDKKELKLMQTIHQETNKLSKIGKALTLISRIENQEFKRLDSVDLCAMVTNIVSNMEEIIQFKKLQIDAKLDTVVIECDHVLADILFTNLVKNAVQHNTQGGFLNLQLNQEKFTISNSGEMPEVEMERLFMRFQKGNPAKDSVGLGLAISQKICEIYGFRLVYERNAKTHSFSVFFQ
ncbi:sensor histidine kinase [Flagellimonas meridianipacifica]|uniref:histidine kinase n=1 Tax=Flagellimonas meridianipacifica TaxID=1080225 RepID=A0A2T0MD41_9FLAO|nr:HAMP domain-containing sensor histidine kinase [Allomuricauda pacifica]PRX55409.1 signal transduction histidine kinase [Allomuricauda pacifica]